MERTTDTTTSKAPESAGHSLLDRLFAVSLFLKMIKQFNGEAAVESRWVTTPPPGGYAAEEGASRFTGRRSASTKGLPIPLANITRAELTSRFSTSPQAGQR